LTLFIQDQDIQKFLSMEACIDMMEEAFRDYGTGVAVNLPRVRMEAPVSTPDMRYYVNTHIGAMPKYETACIRIANQVRPVRKPGADRVRPVIEGKEGETAAGYAQHDWGFVLLFSMQTGQPLALINGFTLSGIRVAATTALAAKYLSRENSHILGILGTGKMAQQHAEALCLVRPVTEIRVYSPSEPHRRLFCTKMRERLKIDVREMGNAQSVVESADMVCCTTNSLKPVVFGEWLSAGQFVSTIVNSDILGLKTEADQNTFTKSDLIVINDKTSVMANRQMELLGLIEKNLFGWEKVRELGKILAGEHPGRTEDQEIIYFKNNSGMAIQFAAAGTAVYHEALKYKDTIREVPTEWFGTDLSQWYREGFRPSN